MKEAAEPVLGVSGDLATAVRSEALAGLEAGVFERWLRGRRWFGGKGRAAWGVRLRDVTPLYAEDPPSCVARLVVDAADGHPATYQVPLAVRPAVPDPDVAPLARVRAGATDGVLFDALEDPVFRQRIGRAFAEGVTFAGPKARWIVSPLDALGRTAIPPAAPARVVRAEQSNTSVLFGASAILKLFRRVEPGENPDVEIGRFLATRTSFRSIPRLFGTVRFEDADGTSSVAAQLQAFVAGSRDGWSHALERLLHELDGRGPVFEPEARRLGELTRGLHEALASDPSDPAFAPAATTAAHVTGWAASVRSQAKRTLGLLSGSTAAARGTADLLEAGEEIAALADALAARVADDAGARIRHHGDYHLGQVLRTPDGDFVIIDFEGEPARPLAERRERHSALRDVAGMLRSFDYAAGAVSRERAGAASAVAAWCARARAAFLEGYRAAGASVVLPRAEASFEALLSLFEIEKALYELAYELDNRPDWAGIPLGGLRAVLARVRRS